jgi:uncharacterized membrane protein HdeD (DUF308 family)
MPFITLTLLFCALAFVDGVISLIVAIKSGMWWLLVAGLLGGLVGIITFGDCYPEPAGVIHGRLGGGARHF